MNKKIDWTKPVQTVGGLQVTVLTTTREHDSYPVVAVVNRDGEYEVETYTDDGRLTTGGGPDNLDLINAPERTSEFRSFNSKGEGGVFKDMVFGGMSLDNLARAKDVSSTFINGEGTIELIREDGKLVDVKFHPLTA